MNDADKTLDRIETSDYWRELMPTLLITGTPFNKNLPPHVLNPELRARLRRRTIDSIRILRIRCWNSRN